MYPYLLVCMQYVIIFKYLQFEILRVCFDCPVNICLFKDNKNPRKGCKICSIVTMKIPERGHWRCSGVFPVNFEHISYLYLVFLYLTLSIYLFTYLTPFSSVSYVKFEHVFIYWVDLIFLVILRLKKNQ